jgi:GNAT superfamily N-acetyltransferase
MHPSQKIIVRDRTGDDIAACQRLVEATHHHDRYPAYLGGSTRSFLCHPPAHRAWVAELDNAVIGHVALHPATSTAVIALACGQLNVTTDQIGVIARLLVSPQQRGCGAGRKLLATAAAQAQAQRLRPILDVDTNLTAAIALYERAGWQRIGVADVSLPDGTTLHEAVYTLSITAAAT